MMRAQKAHFYVTLAILGVYGVLLCIYTEDSFSFLAQSQENHSGKIANSSRTSLHPASASYTFTETPLEELPPFWPNYALERYKRAHNIDAVRHDKDNTRKFAVATYWCPERAGNLLHNFLNSVVWAIITNRTILVDYNDYSNTEADCQAVLKRAEWMVSSSRDDDVSHSLLQRAVAIPIDARRRDYDETIDVVIFPQIVDVDPHGLYFHQSWRNHPLDAANARDYVRSMPQDVLNTAGMLYHQGVDYLFGMLLDEIFDFQLPVPTITMTNPNCSIALHSRHPVVGDDGSFLKDEQACLEKLLLQNNNCTVFLMSDRPKTIELLSDFVRRHHATPVAAAHDAQDAAGVATEHGPFVGSAFLKDLYLSSQARTGVIGDEHRSSFMLLKELVAYRRTIEGMFDDSVPPKFCALPDKPSSGYTYGPNTPTFVHHSLLPVDPTVKAFETYQREVVEESFHNKFALVEFCWTNDDNNASSLYSLLNAFLLSIVTNRILLLTECNNNQDYDTLRTNLHLYKDEKGRLGGDEDELAPKMVEIDVRPIASSSSGEETVKVHLTSKVMQEEAELVVFTTDARRIETIVAPDDDDSSRKLSEDLFHHGPEFLYGLLFDKAFGFEYQAKQSTTGFPLRIPLEQVPGGMPLPQVLAPMNFSVALVSDESSSLESISACFDTILAYKGAIFDACHVYGVFKDDSELMDKVRTKLGSHDCTLWTPVSPDSASFWDDVFFASTARAALIGKMSPKANAVMDLMHYRKRLEERRLGRDPPVMPEIFQCYLT